MQRPTKKEQLEALRAIVGEHGMEEMTKAARLTRELSKEFSHSQAQKKAQEVRELLSHYTPSKIGIVGGTAKNILNRMEETMQEAVFGNGTWLVD
jgi:tRNA A37 threonylcarbamoyltransferase TsaD